MFKKWRKSIEYILLLIVNTNYYIFFPSVLKNDLLLHEAVIKNEADTVRKVLKETVDVDSRNNVSYEKYLRDKNKYVTF